MIKKAPQLIFCIIAFISTVFSCSTEKQDVTDRVSIRLSSSDSFLTLKVSTYNPVNLAESVLGETKSGTNHIEFPLHEPTLAQLQIAGKRMDLYLEPGYDLTVSIDSSSNQIYFRGNGSAANNYLSRISSLQSQIEHAGGKNINDLDTIKFLTRLDSLRDAFAVFHRQYLDSISLPEPVVNLLRKRNTVIVLGIKQNYGFNYAARQDDFKIPEALSVTDEIPYDTVLLTSGLIAYAMELHVMMHTRYFIPFTKKEAQKNDPFTLQKEIENTHFPKTFEELFIAKNIDYWMASMGLTPAVDSLYSNFAKRYPGSTSMPVLQNRRNKWLAIAPGSKAPDFSGITPEGKTISLSSLKGKVVYVDIWASWCSPCRNQFPYAKVIEKEFKHNEQVVFLHVSVDHDKNAWNKLIQTDHSSNCVHILQMPGIGEPIQTLYQTWGVPWYLLIDKDGRIANGNAPQPSSGLVQKEIHKLLD